MAFNNPAVADFKSLFFRDFPFGTDVNVAILDQDVSNSFVKTNIGINPDLWDDQASYTLGYLLLSAHNLVMTLRASSQGINGQFNWAQNNKSVGAVSEGFAIPQRILDNPEFMMLSKTNYGAEYLQLLLPKLVGQIFGVCGSTLA